VAAGAPRVAGAGVGGDDVVEADVFRPEVQVGSLRTLVAAGDAELVQVGVVPVHRGLDDGVEVRQR
jgi:hypothetical protein